jgi:hypothetical protein
MRYEVKPVNVNHRGRFWTVLAWDGDRCLGGDHHWLEPWLADEAKLAYESGAVQHGAPSRLVQAERGKI